jgi:cobalamin biosynthesis Mg chelatase CobN
MNEWVRSTEMDKGLDDANDHRRGLHMKRIAWLLSFSLILLGALQGVAAAQLSGDSDPLDKVKNPTAKEKVDKAKEVVDEALPGTEAPADDVANELEDSADNVVEQSGEVAEDAGGTAGSVADEPTQAGTTSSDVSASGSASKTKLTRSNKRSGTGSKDGSGAEPTDTDKVAAAGNTIGSAPENDEQLAAPEADADESEGSILSSTGAQILAWLVLACLLIAIGAALVRRSRTGSRA